MDNILKMAFQHIAVFHIFMPQLFMAVQVLFGCAAWSSWRTAAVTLSGLDLCNCKLDLKLKKGLWIFTKSLQDLRVLSFGSLSLLNCSHNKPFNFLGSKTFTLLWNLNLCIQFHKIFTIIHPKRIYSFLPFPCYCTTTVAIATHSQVFRFLTISASQLLNCSIAQILMKSSA